MPPLRPPGSRGRAVPLALSKGHRSRDEMSNVANMPDVRPTSAIDAPDTTVKAREVFGVEFDMDVPAFAFRTEHVPELDQTYVFDKETTLAILAGFTFNRRVM